jgi:hypothetical protein
VPRAAKVSLILVFVLALLLVGADRVLAAVAEGQIEKKVTEQLAAQNIKTVGEPSVTVEGVPFLTQVVGKEFKAIRIRLDSVQSTGITLTDLDVRATKVKADVFELMDGKGEITATKVAGTGAVSYSSIAGLLQQPDLTIVADNGKLKLRLPVKFAGQSFAVVAFGTVAMSGGKVKLTVNDVRPDGGGLPGGAQTLLTALAGKLSQELELPALPYDMTVESIEVAGEGLRVHASALNVPLSG